jgi:hypothetical protein
MALGSASCIWSEGVGWADAAGVGLMRGRSRGRCGGSLSATAVSAVPQWCGIASRLQATRRAGSRPEGLLRQMSASLAVGIQTPDSIPPG